MLTNDLDVDRIHIKMAKSIKIRNSTAEFLIFMLEGKEDGM